MIELTEEPYDGPIATDLVAALHREITERYAGEMEEWTEAELAEDTDAYMEEVTPELVAPPHGAFVVAWLGGKPVGCGAVKPVVGGEQLGEVKRMYTVPGARRRGVSRAVLARLEVLATGLGYRRLQLETGTEQPEAVALYEAQGWHRIEPYGRYKDEPSSVCFGKDLSGATDAQACANCV